MKTKTNTEGQRFTKTARGIPENDRCERPVWVRVGTAFVNRDGSLNVYLDALPTNGRLHIRDLTGPSLPEQK